MTTEKIVARFMAKVDKDGPEVRPGLGKCWLWTAAKMPKGYGAFGLTRRNIVLAHRMSYEIHVGPILGSPETKVRHRCDVPACVNPAHLLSGTQAENLADMVERGRSASGDRSGARKHPERVPNGERNGRHQFSDAMIAAVRADRLAGMTQSAIAAKYKMSQANVSLVTRGLSRACATRRM